MFETVHFFCTFCVQHFHFEIAITNVYLQAISIKVVIENLDICSALYPAMFSIVVNMIFKL